MSYRFRSPENWRSALLALPDTAFFDLMRSVFGNIKTPFNKQRLMDDLSALLSTEEIRQTIAAYLDGRDRRIIAAVALLNEPSPGDLEGFFDGEFIYAELHAALLNLEERFILYRFRENGLPRLALNPVLEPVLAPHFAGIPGLFPSLDGERGVEGGEPPPSLRPCGPSLPPPAGGSPRNAPPAADTVSGGLLAAFLAFVFEEPDFFKAGGGNGENSVRKKVLEAGRGFFPGGLFGGLLDSFLNLGLLRREGEKLLPEEPRLRAFTGLSPRERLEYCAAGLCQTGGGACQEQTRVREAAALIHRLLGFLEPDRLYPLISLKRFAAVAEGEESRDNPGERNLPPGLRGGASPGEVPLWKRLDLDRLLGALETTGLLLPAGAREGEPHWRLSPGTGEGDGASGPALAMDTPLSCVLYPEISFGDALSLARFCSLRETGAALRFELNRTSVVRGFDRGMDAAAMIALLSRLSGDRLDGNLGWTLKDWETRYAAVALCQGVVLTLAEDRRYLAEASPLASLIRQVLAPGVYLLSSEDCAGAEGALKRAGVDIVARRDRAFREPERIFSYLNVFPGMAPAAALGGALRGDPPAGGGSEGPQGRSEGGGSPPPPLPSPPLTAEELKGRFRGALDKLKLPKVERDELEARIERRLVLRESQLAGAVIRYEKLEARGLDYVGKASVARQAIALKSAVEAWWTGPEGKTERILGVPAALEKQGGESVLALSPLPGGQELLRLPLGKISLLRRIKQSIFEE